MLFDASIDGFHQSVYGKELPFHILQQVLSYTQKRDYL